ncbi:hypothetical protein [Algoriphagus sp.]|uniref:hypothetical protein n=1 Tax=Algoriphagus sp. TaxID=1872435 RepID=UPI003F71DE8E
MEKSKLVEMNNVGIVVENLDDAISFFSEIGLKLEGRGRVEGEWVGRVTGLENQSVEIAMMVTPDGHSRIELTRFLTPATISDHDHRTAPVNSLGLAIYASCSGLTILTSWCPDSPGKFRGRICGSK